MFPGGSLMDIELIAADLIAVRCPACGAKQLFPVQRNGTTWLTGFLHETEQCPILKRIEVAVQRLQAAMRSTEATGGHSYLGATTRTGSRAEERELR